MQEQQANSRLMAAADGANRQRHGQPQQQQQQHAIVAVDAIVCPAAVMDLLETVSVPNIDEAKAAAAAAWKDGSTLSGLLQVGFLHYAVVAHCFTLQVHSFLPVMFQLQRNTAAAAAAVYTWMIVYTGFRLM